MRHGVGLEEKQKLDQKVKKKRKEIELQSPSLSHSLTINKQQIHAKVVD